MAKADKKTESTQSTENNSAQDAQTAAPVAASDASSTAEASQAEGESIKGDISVEGSKKSGKAKAEKKPSFEPNVAARTELLAMTNDDLRTTAGEIPSTGANDFRIFQIDEQHGLTDQLVGSALERSGIRAGVIDFLRSRTGDNGIKTDNSSFEMAAPGWAIASYMKLATERGVVKGKFDQGYLAARGNDVRRGMVARKQLKIVGDLTPPAPAKAPAADTAETPAAE